jgi:hypothetical protein
MRAELARCRGTLTELAHIMIAENGDAIVNAILAAQQ